MTETANILQSVSIILACWAVIAGIDAWKREFIGKRRIELAESVLAKFYEVNDAIAFIRNPWTNTAEGQSRKKADHETKDESALLDRAYIVFERYEKKKDIFNEFNILKYKAMASFGKDTGEIFDRTNKVLNSIFISAQMLGTHYWQRQGRVHMEGDEFKRHLEEMHKHEGIFWDRYKDEDEIRKELSEILLLLEKITKPCFEEPSTLYSLATKKLLKRG
jgi:hypothetical protein